MTVTSFYRQPVSSIASYTKLQHIIEHILSVNLNCIFLGDFNFNYLDSSHTRGHDLESTYQLKQLITEPTRVTCSTSTCIDHIYTNIPHFHSASGVLPITLSDQFAIFTCLSLKSSQSTKNKLYKRIRNFNQFSQPKGCVTIYADDITLYFSGKNTHVAESNLQNCDDITVKRLKHNHLVVNPSKSTTMLIGTRPKTKNINLAIYIDNIKITQETSIKLLGVEVDANITWNTHISTLAKKISSKIGLVKRLQQFLPSNTVLSL